MNIQLEPFIVFCAAVLGSLALIAGGIAIAASILYRSTLLIRETATLRVLGARRSHVVRMFLSENVLGVLAGVVVGGLALAMLAIGERLHSWFLAVLLSTAALLILAALGGGWLAARHAARVRFDASGLFRTSADTRGH